MKHFQIYELVDRATYMKWGDRCVTLISPDLQFSLDGLRDFFNVPITVNDWYGGGFFQYRGYRGPECAVGAEHSYHKRGMAADFDVKGYTAEDARRIICENQNDERLAKIMRMEDKTNWCHIDIGSIPLGKERIYIFKP
jgi:hypothetical protein